MPACAIAAATPRRARASTWSRMSAISGRHDEHDGPARRGDDGRHLVRQRLAAAGREHGERVAAGEDGRDGLGLPGPKGVVAPRLARSAASASGGAETAASSGMPEASAAHGSLGPRRPPRLPMARLLDGTALAADVRADVARDAAAFAARTGRAPGLRVVLVGAHPASESYVRAKERAAREAGFDAETLRLPDDGHDGRDPRARRARSTPTTPSTASSSSSRCRRPWTRPRSSAPSIRPRTSTASTRSTSGELWLGEPALAPCTPAGIVEMLRRAQRQTAGAHAVVIGRSDIVGKPMAGLLLGRGLDATVTVCHSRTRDLPALTRQADILVAAIGRAGFVTADMVRPGAVVVDVGINRVDDAIARARLPPHGRRGLRGRRADRRGDHARAGRRRADDDRDAARQHGRRPRRARPGRAAPCGRRFGRPSAEPRPRCPSCAS